MFAYNVIYYTFYNGTISLLISKSDQTVGCKVLHSLFLKKTSWHNGGDLWLFNAPMNIYPAHSIAWWKSDRLYIN